MNPTWEREGVQLYLGDCRDVLPHLSGVDAVVTDPPYAEIDRDYGRFTEEEWHDLMNFVVPECRRLISSGSAVFILQPNSERVGRMRPWLWEFMAKWSRDWNMVQDAWWWNHAAPPNKHANRDVGLMRPSVKACVWLGSSNCFRNQDAALWDESEANKAQRLQQRFTRGYKPYGGIMDTERCLSACVERGGVTPFNLLPVANANSTDSGGACGHHAATPLPVAEWWVKYISPIDGVVLDPFCGSGTMAIASIRQNRGFVGVEKHEPYFQIAKQRIINELERMPLFKEPKQEQITMFGGE